MSKYPAEVFKQILDDLENDAKVEIENFGIFELEKYPARMGKNPVTGEDMEIPEGARLKFKLDKQAADRFGITLRTSVFNRAMNTD